MKILNRDKITEIALKYAFQKNKLNNKNVECFIDGFTMSQEICSESLLDVLNKIAERERRFEEEYNEELAYSGYVYLRPADYDETIANHKKYLEAVENLIKVIEDTKLNPTV